MHQRRRFPSLPIKHRRERGTTAVEFALIFPILFVLIFGIVEIGWTLEQEHGVQSSAQAVAREAAINFAEAEVTDMDATISAICAELNLQTDAEVTVELPDGTAPGDTVLVTITEDLEQATGMFGPLLNGKTVTGQAAARLEQEAAYTGVATQQCDGTVVATPTPAPSPTPTSTPMPGPTPTPTPVPTATPVPAGTPTPAPTETPTPTPSCTVPDFDNVRKNNATTLWTSAGFSGSITFQSGSGNYRIHYQSLSASASASCDSIIEVGP